MKKRRFLIVLICAIMFIVYMYNMFSIVKKMKAVDGVIFENDNVEIIRKKLNGSGKKIIIIDPGHGGNDPGKVGVNGVLEKDINLKIAFYLKNKLVENGFDVIMTRDEDIGLYNEWDRSKKNADLRNRVNIVNESDAIMMISIHQNAFTSEKEKGAQVFYYSKSKNSINIAKCVQESLKKYYDDSNSRVEKSNDSYYILKKTSKPAILVECGFLSNKVEADNLLKEEIQVKIATAISNGIIIWANKILEGVY